MTDISYVSVIIGSGDINAFGNASDFTCPIPYLDLGDNSKWEVCLRSISCPKPASGLPVSLIVYSDICDNSSIGNQQLPVLFRTSPVQSTDSDPVYRESTAVVVPWKQVLSQNYLTQIRIQVLTITGVAVPTGASDFTTVELIFRKIS